MKTYADALLAAALLLFLLSACLDYTQAVEAHVSFVLAASEAELAALPRFGGCCSPLSVNLSINSSGGLQCSC